MACSCNSCRLFMASGYNFDIVRAYDAVRLHSAPISATQFARLLGFKSIRGLKKGYTVEKYRPVLLALRGPNSLTVYKMLKARK